MVEWYLLFEKYGLDNCTIILLESVCAGSKDELESREAFYIQNSKCVNRNIPGRKKLFGNVAYNKIYQDENKTKIAEQHKAFYASNRQTIIDRATKYNLENKEKRSITCKKYYEKKKHLIAEKVLCNICCCNIRGGHIRRHEQSNKHQTFLKSQTQYEYQWEDGTPCTLQDYIHTN